MSLFERWLTLWVALCILAGLLLGNLFPVLFRVLAGLEYASVNLVVAVAFCVVATTLGWDLEPDLLAGIGSAFRQPLRG